VKSFRLVDQWQVKWRQERRGREMKRQGKALETVKVGPEGKAQPKTETLKGHAENENTQSRKREGRKLRVRTFAKMGRWTLSVRKSLYKPSGRTCLTIEGLSLKGKDRGNTASQGQEDFT